jgi:Uma2 family endonuclease
MSPTKGGHGVWEARIVGHLFLFDPQGKRGWILAGEAGVYTQRNPDTVRGMDAAFISKMRHPARPEGFLEVAPELVVEILSPHDRWRDVQDKIEEYFAIGVVQLWLVDPTSRVVYVYHSPTDSIRLAETDTLQGEGILAGFSLPLADLFAE